jgi:hypothetical protein
VPSTIADTFAASGCVPGLRARHILIVRTRAEPSGDSLFDDALVPVEELELLLDGGRTKRHAEFPSCVADRPVEPRRP